MVELGFTLSSEEHKPKALVEQAVAAEAAGFGFVSISDHFHPWIDAQGESPFCWAVLGAVAQATKRIRAGTGVTCPLIRYHPALVAQMAATVADMFEGRFYLGLGTGERLNEHITGEHWPPPDVRDEMLAEAVEVIRLLWRGGLQSHDGDYYAVEEAQVYTLPERLPEIYIAAAGKRSAELAGRIGDGFVSTAPMRELVEAFSRSGGAGKPRYAQMTVCWAEDETSAQETAMRQWPVAALSGPEMAELRVPSHFESAAKLVTPDKLSPTVALGPDPERHLEMLGKYVDAGYDHVYVHQIGPDQQGCIDFYERQVMPQLGRFEQRRTA
jgi:G6PDH family F420-dependent oxidoreductase